MKILSLKAENVQKIKVVEIRPDGNLVVIGGKNAQGKTSVLDAIEQAFAGKRALKDKPVREGADYSETEIELDGDFIVRRKTHKDGRSELAVHDKHGGKYSSPQKLLDSFSAKFTFDPLRFKSLDSKAQADLLKELLGLNFDALDAKRKAAYDERTEVNREIKNLEGHLSQLQTDPSVGLELVSAAELVKEFEQLNQHFADKQGIENRIEYHVQQGKEKAATIERLKQEIEQHVSEIKNLQTELNGYQADDQRAELQQRITDIDVVNDKVRANLQAKKLTESLSAENQRAHALSQTIDKIDAEKVRLLAEANMPVEGLSVDENSVSYNGVPFSQCSAAEQLRVSVAMGIALNPKLKVLLVRDASLLDEDNLALVANMAAQHDCQVWLERVGEGEEVSVVLEDGMIKQ